MIVDVPQKAKAQARMFCHLIRWTEILHLKYVLNHFEAFPVTSTHWHKWSLNKSCAMISTTLLRSNNNRMTPLPSPSEVKRLFITLRIALSVGECNVVSPTYV